MKYLQKFLFGAACLVSLAASAQWQWTDKDGRKVFSDRAPPSEVPEKNIIKRPGNRPTPPTATDSSPNPAASAPQGAASAPKVSGVDKELLDKKKKAEEAEVAKRKTEEERVLKAKVENCARAKQAKISLSSNARIAHFNEKGEQTLMDDATRAAEIKRIQSIIESDCK